MTLVSCGTSVSRQPVVWWRAATRSVSSLGHGRCRAPRRDEGQHESVFRREVGTRRALNVGGRQFLEDVELAVGGLDVVMNHDRVGESLSLLLVRLAAENVVARELVLRSLKLPLRN